MTEPPEQSEHWLKVRRLFEQVITIRQEKRGEWLDINCKDDARLRSAVDELVKASEDNLEIIDMTIQQASNDYLDDVSGRHRKLRAGGRPRNPNARQIQRMRRAFACIAAFFASSARARSTSDPARSAADAELGRAFGRAADSEISAGSADALRAVLQSLVGNSIDDGTAEALRKWLDILDEGGD